MKIIKKIPYNSISFKLITTILIMTIPLILLLIYSNTYASQVVRSQVASSYQNIMESYMNQLDRDLENTNMYIHNMIALDDNFLSIEQSRSDADYSMAKILFVNDLKQQLPLYSVIDAFWVYKISKQDLISVYNYRPAYTKQLDINSYFIDYLENNWSNESGTYKWQSHKIGEKYYIAYFIKRGDVYFGAWIDLNRLNSRIEISDLGPKSGSWFISSDGNIMANQWGLADNQIKEKISTIENLSFENSEDAVIIREKSVNSDTSLVSAIPNETILENIPLLQRMSWMLIVLSLFVIPVCLYIIRKIILIPIYRLVKAMKHIQNNNLNYRISEYKSADEYILMNKTFNRMLSQIEQLKIDVYEEKINKQHEELQHLKLQINPHFFLNSLNILYSLAKLKDYELIKELTLSLIKYFQFVFRNKSTFVSLKDEVGHTTNYLKIQELRYLNQFSYTIIVPTYLEDTRIPPLLILTFVENAVKHAVSLDEEIQINVEVKIIEKKDAPFLNINIVDTGVGFSEELLTKLNSHQTIVNEQGEHTGIWNIDRRLTLLYDGHAYLEFRNNQPSGAIVEVFIPLS